MSLAVFGENAPKSWNVCIVRPPERGTFISGYPPEDRQVKPLTRDQQNPLGSKGS